MTTSNRRVVTTGAQGTAGVAGYRSVSPLFSTVGIAGGAAIPSSLTLFGYRIGDNVPGTGNGAGFASTGWHTNMRVAGQLPRPEMFTVTGIRVMMPMLAFAGSDTPGLVDTGFSAAALADSDAVEDLMRLFGSSYLEFEIGNKLYAQHPLWMFPGNNGVGGIAAVSQDNAGATAVQHLDITAVHMEGVQFTLAPFLTADGQTRGPLLIAEQQAFGVRLETRWATPPSFNDDRVVQVFLDGEHVRASQ